MSVKKVHASGTYTANGSTAVVVGSGSVLADDDLSTYIGDTVWGVQGWTVGLEPLTGYTSGDPINLRVQMIVHIQEGDFAEAEMFIATDAAGMAEIGGFSDGSRSGFGFFLTETPGTSSLDLTVPLRLTGWGTTVPDIVAALEAGAFLDVNAITGASPTLTSHRVCEAWIEVGLPSTKRHRAPKRCFPRSDGRGRYPSTSMRSFPVEP